MACSICHLLSIGVDFPEMGHGFTAREEDGMVTVPIVKTKHREIPDMAYYHSPEANSHIETIKCA